MAQNKECLIIVLDVRRCADEDFKLKSVKCVSEILKDKICAAKKDYISLVLVGTATTNNDLNNDIHDGYMNVTQYSHMQVADWQLLINFYKFVNTEPCNEGDWLDGLVVAMNVLKKCEENYKYQRQRIVLFHDFNGYPSGYDMFTDITENLAKFEIDLIVVSHNIRYKDNAETEAAQPIFDDSNKRNAHQLENEKYALKLVSHCNAVLCNFTEALHTIFKVCNKRPWAWSQMLTIGSKIKINITGVIAIKDISNIQLKKCWGAADAHVSFEWKHFIDDKEIEPLDADLISAYMLGATPIPYDETLADEKREYLPGLKFIGFAKRANIPEEYFCGDSLYWIIHRKGMAGSAKKLDALVKAMLKNEMAMLCWKIYGKVHNNPKLVVLLPNEFHDDRPASLSMIDLSYHEQHHFWDFPALCTSKTDCTEEQLDAIDGLIDAMDLTLSVKETQQSRLTQQKDLLPFDALPHIFEHNVLDVLERKIITNVSEDDEQFQEMLKDKNFSEIYWKVPELREEEAKRAVKKVKNLFPLEKGTLKYERAKAAEKAAVAQNNNNNNKAETANGPLVPLNFDSVRKIAPADDFEKLLKHHVITLKDKTLRDAKFQGYATQLRATVCELITKDAALEVEKVMDALKVYRKSCFDFNTFVDYNKWIGEIKSIVVERKLYDFWRRVIVAEKLGLCFVGDESLESKLAQKQFYALEDAESCSLAASQDDDMDDTEVDNLLASI